MKPKETEWILIDRRPGGKLTLTRIQYRDEVAKVDMKVATYSTAKLIELFEVPPSLASELPSDSDPLPHPNTVWGWKQHSSISKVEGPLFVGTEEKTTWEYGDWSTLLYDHIP